MICSVIYFAIILVIALLGVFLIRRGLRKPRRFLLVFAGLFLIAAPYPADLIFTRIVHIGESPKTAWLPTTFVLAALEPKADGAYGVIFDRFNKAPSRHHFFNWQKASYARWCLDCVRSGDPAMIKRGVQISANLAMEQDAAVFALGEALETGPPPVRLLACDILLTLGSRAELVRPHIEEAALDKDAKVEAQAQVILKRLADPTYGP